MTDPRSDHQTDPAARAATADYVDHYEAELSGDDARSAEALMRDGLEGAPAVVRRLVPLVHRHVLRLRIGSTRDPSRILGWRIEVSEPDRVVLRSESPLADAVLVGARDPDRVRLTTSLTYRRPRLAAAVWRGVGPLHRLVAPVLLRRAAASDRP